MEARPTLQDIADLVGVGKATVSLALRNHPKISTATRDRVKAAAEKLGYRPDPALSKIAAHRWRSREHPSDFVVAFITMRHPWTRSEPLVEMRLAAREHGARFGYVVEHFCLDDYSGAAQLSRVLLNRGIRGVLLGQLFCDDFLQQFQWDSFCCVSCQVGYVKPPVNLVLPDFHHAVVQAWQEAARAGAQRIGVALLGEMEAVDLFDKVSAVLYCQSRVTPDLPRLPVCHFPPSDRAPFAAWMETEQPDVVLGFNDGVYWWLREIGRLVPQEVGFVSLDTVPVRLTENLRLTGMDPDYSQIGRTALEQLDLLLRTNQQGIPARPLTVHVPYVWIAGDTLMRTPEPVAAAR
jgi:LacI family transcriptional regulator